MKEYRSTIMLVTVIVCFMISIYQMVINHQLDYEMNTQMEYVAKCIEDATLKQFTEIENIQKSYFNKNFSNATNIAPKLKSTRYPNNEGRIVIDPASISRDLEMLIQPIELVDNAYIVLENGEIYTYSKKSNYNTLYSIINKSNEVEDKTYVRSEDNGLNNEKVLLFIKPFFSNDYVHLGTLYFEVPYSKLFDYFSNMNFYVTNYGVRVYDSQNYTIFDNTSKLLISSENTDNYKSVESMEAKIDETVTKRLSDYQVRINITGSKQKVFSELFTMDINLIYVGLITVFISAFLIRVSNSKANYFYIILVTTAGIAIFLNICFTTLRIINRSRLTVVENACNMYITEVNNNYKRNFEKVKLMADNITLGGQKVIKNMDKDVLTLFNRIISQDKMENVILVDKDTVYSIIQYANGYIDEKKIREIYDYEMKRYGSIDSLSTLEGKEDENREQYNTINVLNDELYMITHKIFGTDVLIILFANRITLNDYFKLLDYDSVIDISYITEGMPKDELYSIMREEVKRFDREITIKNIKDFFNSLRFISNRKKKEANNAGGESMNDDKNDGNNDSSEDANNNQNSNSNENSNDSNTNGDIIVLGKQGQTQGISNIKENDDDNDNDDDKNTNNQKDNKNNKDIKTKKEGNNKEIKESKESNNRNININNIYRNEISYGVVSSKSENLKSSSYNNVMGLVDKYIKVINEIKSKINNKDDDGNVESYEELLKKYYSNYQNVDRYSDKPMVNIVYLTYIKHFTILNKELTYVSSIYEDIRYNITEGSIIKFSNASFNLVTEIFIVILIGVLTVIITRIYTIRKRIKEINELNDNIYKSNAILNDIEERLGNIPDEDVSMIQVYRDNKLRDEQKNSENNDSNNDSNSNNNDNNDNDNNNNNNNNNNNY